MHHHDDNSILIDEQHDFRGKRSCETQLITVINDFATNLNDGLQTDVILLDMMKAFDKVSHELLCGKLYNYGIRGNTLGWIQCL